MNRSHDLRPKRFSPFVADQLRAYIRASAEIISLTDLKVMTQQAARDLGYDCFTMVQHVDLTRSLDGVVAISTFDPDWIARAITRRYFRIDPVHLLSGRIDAPFGWSSLPDLMRLSVRQQRLIAEARHYGLVDGLTVPLFIPGEQRASCTFAGARPRPVDDDVLAAAHIIATFGYQAALRIVFMDGTGRPRPRPELTTRQVDCLVFVAQGKNDWEIGKILGLSGDTVHFHITQAMHRYDVCKRTALVINALHDGVISFHQIARL
jgi:LuxR family quorum-sensing system transcriptional regulator CciR